MGMVAIVPAAWVSGFPMLQRPSPPQPDTDARKRSRVEDHPRSQGRNDGGSHAGTSTIGVMPESAGIQ